MRYSLQKNPKKLFLLDLGNSRLNGGIFFVDKIYSKFSMPSKSGCSLEDYLTWFSQILSGEKIDDIGGVAISSVVPEDTPVLLKACQHFFTHAQSIVELDPTHTAIELCCETPTEVGADRVANFLGARHFFPQEKFPEHAILIFDCGTATTAGVLNSQNQFVGGLIAPGLQTSLEGLRLKASQLSGLDVPLIRPSKILGTNTIDNIQAGIYFSALGLMRELKNQLQTRRQFEKLIVIGTGGFSGLFKDEQIFDFHEPDLILWGLVEFWCHQFSEGGVA
jgi:type III pantothenate kinase